MLKCLKPKRLWKLRKLRVKRKVKGWKPKKYSEASAWFSMTQTVIKYVSITPSSIRSRGFRAEQISELRSVKRRCSLADKKTFFNKRIDDCLRNFLSSFAMNLIKRLKLSKRRFLHDPECNRRWKFRTKTCIERPRKKENSTVTNWFCVSAASRNLNRYRKT